MGTLAITSSGFAAMPGTAPPGWPANIVWPAGGSINGTKTFTISDADAQQMLAWIAWRYNAQLTGDALPTAPPVSISAIQIFLVWLNGWMDATTDATQHYHTPAPVVPPPISIS
jgi:hypothetical protein